MMEIQNDPNCIYDQRLNPHSKSMHLIFKGQIMEEDKKMRKLSSALTMVKHFNLMH